MQIRKRRDCRLFAFEKLFEMNGNVNYKTEDFLGIGAGLAFEYDICQNKLPIISIHGRKLINEEIMGRNGIIPIETRILENEEELEMLFSLEKPFVVNVDKFYLNYLHVEHSHFGYHAVLILKKSGSDVLVYDGLCNDVEKINYTDLMKAIFSKTTFYPTERKCYIYKTSFYKECSIDIKDTIMQQCNYILNNNNYNIGIILDNLLGMDFNSQMSKENYFMYQMEHIQSCFREQEFEGTFYRATYYDWLKKHIGQTILGDKWIETWKKLGRVIYDSNLSLEENRNNLVNQLKNCELVEKEFFVKVQNMIERGVII